MIETNDVAVTMTAIFGSMLAVCGGLVAIQTKITGGDRDSRLLPNPITEPSKRAYEIYALCYTPVWIFAFACIVGLGLYEDFDKWSYLKVLVGLSLPFLLQPVIYPSAGSSGCPDAKRPLLERYSFKANAWLAVYSFIGNYWYTHYFYSVLRAKYTMPAHRLNNVPLALYFATHFYFSTYHVFSNLLLRKVVTTFEPGMARKLLYVTVVFTFAYFTAFMETLTISAYPDYSFEDRNMAYTVGSAFYGIYFIVSFPAFFVFDKDIDNAEAKTKTTVWDTIVSSCGYGMIIMILLDIVRLYLDIPLVVGSSDMVCSINQ
uniref:Cycloeucalenol cycloisomerase n=1 Tax=Pseudo-nitzschia australis TaxID=44445 RepID=A0A7S4AR68_9STRA